MYFKIKTINTIHSTGLNSFSNNKYTISEDIDNPDAIILRSASLHNEEFPSSLKAIARAGTGVNNIPIDKCSDKGIVVFNTLGANANAVKELVLAGMVMSSRNLIQGSSWTQSLSKDVSNMDTLIEQNKKQFVGFELQNKTLGVIGLGAIGHSVANLGISLNMNVLGYDPFLSVHNAVKLSPQVAIAKTLEEIIAQSDFITIHVGYSEQTHHLINKKLLASCKKNATLLNFARKELVEEQAVINMLDKNILHKYICDFPSVNTLHNDNIIAFPHLGASTQESEANCSVLAAKAIQNFLEYGIIHGSVNYPNCSLPLHRETTTRLLVGNSNEANILAKITDILGKNNININNMINTHRGHNAYNIIDVNQEINEHIIKEISQMKEIYFVYQIKQK